MNALIVYCHPNRQSYTHAVKQVVSDRLQQAGAQVQVLDLYDLGFDPGLSAGALEHYDDLNRNQSGVEDSCAALAWCDTLIFVYPTWWHGLPAMLKGWLDRVLVPGVAFHLPSSGQGADIRPGLTHITRLAVFTTHGASWWMTRAIGAPGRRILLRGVRMICAKRCRTAFAAHYRMDQSTPASRSAHLARVDRKLERLLQS